MALTKVTYVSGTTVITASNLNDIQDEIIANASDINTNAANIATLNSGKQDAPTATGTEGQVLGLDSNLEPTWLDHASYQMQITDDGNGTVTINLVET